MTGLAPYLLPELRTKPLAGAHIICDDGRQAEALTRLVPHPPPEPLTEDVIEALAAARSISNDGSRLSAISFCVPHLITHFDRNDAHTALMWYETLRACARRGRPSLLSDLTALNP